MRGIYTLEQTRKMREYFSESLKGIDGVFLGNLYLKGKPYTSPNEAVDKQYVDERFASFDEESLKGKEIPDKLYPAFNGDLVNITNQNDFILKSAVKGNRFHKPIFDLNGRVIGGSIGGYSARMEDIESIDHNTVTYPDNMTSDMLMNGFNKSLYLNKVSANNITKPLRLDKYDQGEHTIIPEVEVKAIQGNYFSGSISGKMEVGEAPGGKFEVEWGDEHGHGGQPWWNARGMFDVDLKDNAYPVLSSSPDQNTFVSSNFYIYKRKYVRMDGTYNEYRTIENKGFSGYGTLKVGVPSGYRCKISDGSMFYIHNDRLCLYMNNGSSGYWTTCDLEDDGLPVGNWDTPLATPLGIPLMRAGYFYVFGVQGKSSSAMYKLDSDGRLGPRISLGNNTVFPSSAFNGHRTDHTNVRLRAVGKYVYAFLDNRTYLKGNSLYRIGKRLLLPEETPESGWLDHRLIGWDGYMSGNKNSIPILTTNHLYIFTIARDGTECPIFYQFNVDKDDNVKLYKWVHTSLSGDKNNNQDRYFAVIGKDGLLRFDNLKAGTSGYNSGITGTIPDFVDETTYY